MRIEKRILCIWLPNWPIQRVVVDQPALKGKPVLLHTRDARRGDVIRACSYLAKRNGVRVGMPLAEATALVSRSERKKSNRKSSDRFAKPTKNIQTHDPIADLRHLRKLARWCQQLFSPLVGWEQSECPQCLLLDVSGTSHLFGGEMSMANQVAQEFRRRGYWPHVAIAKTIGAALACARFQVFGSRLKETDGALMFPEPVVIRSETTVESLKDVPVAALRIDDQARSRLQQLGVATIGQLLQLPRDAIRSRFGSAVLQRLDQAVGTMDEVLAVVPPSSEFQSAITLEHPTDRRDVIERILQRLTNELIEQLAHSDRGAIQVQCEFINSERRKAHFEIGLFSPTVSAPHVLSLFLMQLESRTLPRSIVTVRLQAITTARLPQTQRKLLSDWSRDKPQQLSCLIDRIASRLGSQAVVGARLRAGALPEISFVTVPLTGDPSSRARLQAASGRRAAPKPMERPLLLFDPPQKIEVVILQAEAKTDTILPPSQFQFDQGMQKVVRSWGPERIETSWWKGPCIRRDYYRVESERGNYFWLFRRLEDGQWFVHGEFA